MIFCPCNGNGRGNGKGGENVNHTRYLGAYGQKVPLGIPELMDNEKNVAYWPKLHFDL